MSKREELANVIANHFGQNPHLSALDQWSDVVDDILDCLMDPSEEMLEAALEAQHLAFKRFEDMPKRGDFAPYPLIRAALQAVKGSK